MNSNIKAEVVYVGRNGEEEIRLGEHLLQCGGHGDGYCYGHQSFDCWDNLTSEERKALSEC